MAMKNPYDTYRQNSIFTCSKEELTLMLYEGALKYCNQAIVATEAKDVPKATESIYKIQEIIREFQVTLNHKYEVSKYFSSMYDYIYRRLLDANTRKDPKILYEIRDLLRDFRDMWKEAMALAKKQ